MNQHEYDWRPLEEIQADTLEKIRLANLPPEKAKAERTASLLDEIKRADEFAAAERMAGVARYYRNRSDNRSSK